MDIPALVDELYGAFTDRLGGALATSARELPRALGLAPMAVPWSRVFSHEVTLGAPALIADATPELDPSILRDAVLAHLLGVIEAFGTDRIEDQQIESTTEVVAVLARARRERDAALARVLRGHAGTDYADYQSADAKTISAIRRERAILVSAEPIGFDEYERASLAKQCIGSVASDAMVRRCRWSARRCRVVQETLEAVWLGLQVGDDVVDWEEDLQRGGAWAVCLMKGMHSSDANDEGRHPNESIRSTVLRSRVLAAMLGRARRHMRRAKRRASVLGAFRLATWAASQETRLTALVAAENRCAGYAVRASALSAWAAEVLS